MKELIRHLLRCNTEQIVARSLAHCHTPNLHSIMLLECPGKTIRMFVAEPGNKLWGNFPRHVKQDQSIGFHAHHCELTFVPVTDCVYNWRVKKAGPEAGLRTNEYLYRSKIEQGEIGFKLLGCAGIETESMAEMEVGKSYYMPAEQMHTIAVHRGTWSAWMVFEGRENPQHDKHTFTTQDLSGSSFEGLYQPMSQTRILELLSCVRFYP